MSTLEARFFRWLERLLVALLAAMVVMVFGNVMLRWFANGGIQVSEELSRFCFVWLTFVGAVVVMRENGHLGVDAFVRLLGPKGRLACLMLSDLLVLLCCALFFWGSWRQAPLHLTNLAPVTGLNTLWVFGIGFFTAVGIAVLVAARLLRAATGRLRAGELDAFAGTRSDEALADSLQGRLQ